MKLKTVLSSTLFLLSLPVAALLAADRHDSHASAPKQADNSADAQLIAKARASYPLKTCLVSDEALGSMGEALGYVHRAAGQPDRVVFFCCKSCIADFKADPAKYLKKVDAAAQQAPAAKAEKKSHSH